MEDKSIVIVGAGMAGLAAARDLISTGFDVTILEARNRAGGRIHTILSGTKQVPVELGAEFIHGEKNEAWTTIREAKLQTHEVPDRHWRFLKGQLTEYPAFWNELDQVMGKIDPSAPDQDFESFLRHTSGLTEFAKWLAKEYVEGFHAAFANRIGVRALAAANAAAERDKATRQFRISDGYAALSRMMVQKLLAQNTSIHYETVVKAVRWEPGQVEIETHTAHGPRTFTAARALVTLPLGVLKQGEVLFEPRLVEKDEPIRSLEMGSVVKIILEFRSRFWPVENFGFIHSDDEWFPTWWADERGLLLIGWAGGSRAHSLGLETEDTIREKALCALTRILNVESRKAQELLAVAHRHDWAKDPYAGGAYSYTPVGMMDMPGRLADPVSETLFFAGEATVSDGEQGTVHGAMASGKRAARELQARFPLRAVP